MLCHNAEVARPVEPPEASPQIVSVSQIAGGKITTLEVLFIGVLEQFDNNRQAERAGAVHWCFGTQIKGASKNQLERADITFGSFDPRVTQGLQACEGSGRCR